MAQIDAEVLKYRINEFERRHAEMTPQRAEGELIDILTPLFKADGYSLEYIGGPGDAGVDYLARRHLSSDPRPLTTMVQYKHYRRPRRIGVEVVRQVMGAALLGQYERAILLANADFTRPAEDALLHDLPFEFQLMNINALRAWARRIERAQQEDVSPIVQAVTELSRTLARLVAGNPRYLDEIEWRDMERLLATVFNELGFDVELTPPAKDGGKDIILTCVVSGRDTKFLVEVRHWRTGKKVGAGLLKEFVHVLAAEQAEHGLYIATYGYATDAIEALTELERKKLKFGQENKVVSLCQTFVRAESGIWSPPRSLTEIVFQDTI
jgi:restriction system protein